MIQDVRINPRQLVARSNTYTLRFISSYPVRRSLRVEDCGALSLEWEVAPEDLHAALHGDDSKPYTSRETLVFTYKKGAHSLRISLEMSALHQGLLGAALHYGKYLQVSPPHDTEIHTLGLYSNPPLQVVGTMSRPHMSIYVPALGLDFEMDTDISFFTSVPSGNHSDRCPPKRAGHVHFKVRPSLSVATSAHGRVFLLLLEDLYDDLDEINALLSSS